MRKPDLKKGDRVVCLNMNNETSVVFGDWGTVTSVVSVKGITQYGVNWDNGSKLNLLSDLDIWDTKLPRKKNRLTEDDKNDFFMKNIDVFKYFNMKFFKKYLLMVRDSSITNMLGASLYLYTGRERIEHEFKYKEISNEEAFEEVLENADRAQAEMINGVIQYLEDKNIEESMENVNKYVHRFASKIAHTYIYL
jgi:hypothetical protein